MKNQEAQMNLDGGQTISSFLLPPSLRSAGQHSHGTQVDAGYFLQAGYITTDTT